MDRPPHRSGRGRDGRDVPAVVPPGELRRQDVAIEEGTDVARTIVDYAREEGFDSIVIGAAGEGILRKTLFGEIPETVGEAFDGEVVMVRKHRPVQSAVRSFVRKWVGKGTGAVDRET